MKYLASVALLQGDMVSKGFVAIFNEDMRPEHVFGVDGSRIGLGTSYDRVLVNSIVIPIDEVEL